MDSILDLSVDVATYSIVGATFSILLCSLFAFMAMATFYSNALSATKLPIKILMYTLSILCVPLWIFTSIKQSEDTINNQLSHWQYKNYSVVNDIGTSSLRVLDKISEKEVKVFECKDKTVRECLKIIEADLN